MLRKRALSAGMVLATLLADPRAALAQVAAADRSPPPAVAFDYQVPVEKDYLRASLEIPAILVAGYVQYTQEGANSRDWDLGYDWPSFRSKLTGASASFDTNHFDTNMLTHPGSGLLYYQAARGNRLAIPESALFTLAASTFWEYIGEFREQVSINDMIVTPIAGVAVGETLTQLGAYFDRGRKSTLTEALSLVFGPSKKVHDWIDGSEPRRSRDVDALGFSREGDHDFELHAGVGATTGSTSPKTYADVTFGLRTHLVNVPEYQRAGRARRFLSDGNVSSLTAEATVGAAGLVDVSLLTQVAPIGWYEQWLEGAEGSLHGGRLFVGTTVGFDYALHTYDRERTAARDAISTVHLGGGTLECDGALGPVRVRTALDARPSFAAVHAIARDAYLDRGGGESALPTVTRDEGYYFAVGATVAPRVVVEARGWQVGGEARWDHYWSIGGLDRDRDAHTVGVTLEDWRATSKAWVGFAPVDALVMSVALLHRVRGGRVAAMTATRDESTVLSSITAVF